MNGESGSFACPLCSSETPHSHSVADLIVAADRLNERAGEEYGAWNQEASIALARKRDSILAQALERDPAMRSPEWYACEWLAEHARFLRESEMSDGTKKMTWSDANSAPQTGEHILVTQRGEGGFGICGGTWRDGGERRMEIVGGKRQDWCAVVHYWSNPGEEGFYLSTGASDPMDDRPMRFTHWMPLPTENGGEMVTIPRRELEHLQKTESLAHRLMAEPVIQKLQNLLESVHPPRAAALPAPGEET